MKGHMDENQQDTANHNSVQTKTKLWLPPSYNKNKAFINNEQISLLNTTDTDAWKTYWKAQGQPWRTEPEIDADRQRYLAERRAIVPDIEKGIYPFKDIEPKLTRADVEWLLVTHDNGRGPIDWSNERQREWWGLDLRGAILSQLNLHSLPLARLRGGLTSREWDAATDTQRDMAAVRITNTDLFRTHLEGARLRRAHLEDSKLLLAHLEEAYMEEAYLERTYLFRTHFEGTDLRGSHLEDAVLYEAFFDTGTNLRNAILGKAKLGSAFLADVHWGGANLANLNWSQMKMLGDEYIAKQKKRDGTLKDTEMRLKEYEQADRANRQLAIELQAQGLSEAAAHFAYRAQRCRQRLLLFQLLQYIAEVPILNHLIRKPQQTPENLNLLAASIMLIVFAFGFWFFQNLNPQLAQMTFGSSSLPVFMVLLLVTILLSFTILFLYYPITRLLLFFVFLASLDLVLLYLALFFLVSTLLFSGWQINLILMLLMILMFATTFWTIRTMPEAEGKETFIIATRLWNIILKYKGPISSWILILIRIQADYGRYIFSLFLDIIAGYGYRPGRSLFWYLVIIFGFATAYHVLGHIPLLPDAFVYSLTSFHGRGFLPNLDGQNLTLHNPLVVMAAFEAVVGLLIEISFIATFTHRFFGR
jgi:hypothetical protein